MVGVQLSKGVLSVRSKPGLVKLFGLARLPQLNCFSVLLVLALLMPFPGLAAAVSVDESSEKALLSYEEDDETFSKLMSATYQDDLFEMIDRGFVRVAVTYSKTHYFLDEGRQYGLTYEVLREFERYLNGRYKSRRKGKSLSVLPIPVPRDELIPKLAQGHFDLAVANLTITPERSALVEFSIPTIRDTSEVIVSSKAAPRLDSLEALSGKSVMVRASSSFYEHLKAVNQELGEKGLMAIKIVEADEHLETEDLIEMANADLIDYTVADLHIARLWVQIFDNIRVYERLKIARDTDIAWALRKDMPNLRFEVNRFLKKHRSGTTFGNVLKQRYLQNPYWAKRALQDEERARFKNLTSLFEQYASLYDFNYLMLLAQGYQESRLDHSRKSPVGAIGIMQLMPSTGKAMEVGDIEKIENNVHAGSKYLRKIINTYFDEPEIDETNRILFGFAAYNAGPSRIKRLRRTAQRMGLNPNVWFGNVEHAVARYVGRETVTYVANISKYYIAYRLIEEQAEKRQQRIPRELSN